MAQLHPQTAIALGNLLHKLSGSEKKRANGRSIRHEVLDIIKEVEPGYKLPADVEVQNLKNELRAEREKEKRDNQAAAATNRRAKQRKELVDELGEDEVKRIEEGVLKKYPHLDFKDAATLHAAETGPVSLRGRDNPPSRHGQLWEYPVPEGVTPQAFIANPDKTAQDVAYAVIDGFRGRR